jgi:chromosome segregation ATPase
MAISSDDVPTNYVETVLLGAAVGTVVFAAVGATVGAVLTAPRGGDGAVYGAVAGATLGLGLGTGDGMKIAEQKENFAVQQARYDCQIQAAQIENEGLSGASSRLKGAVDALSVQLDQLEHEYADKRMSRAQAQKELNDIDDAAASLKHRLVVMRDGAAKFQQYASATADLAKGTDMAIDEARLNSLDQQIAAMRERNSDLEQAYEQLAERRKALVLQ